MKPRRPSRLRSVHPAQMVLGLDWPEQELAQRRHLVALPAPVREPEPITPVVALRQERAA